MAIVALSSQHVVSFLNSFLSSPWSVDRSVDQGCGSESAFIFTPGSGSAFNMRIWHQEGKIVKYKTEKCKKIVNICKFIQIFKVNCTIFIASYFWVIFYVFYNDRKLFIWLIFKLVLAGSGSAFRKTAGSGFAKNECGFTFLLETISQKSRYIRSVVEPNYCCGSGLFRCNSEIAT